MPKTWTYRNRETRYQFKGVTLKAYWEVSHDPISNDYTTSEISAADLFSRWAKEVKVKHPGGLIPIHWFVSGEAPDVANFAYMPFQFEHMPQHKDIPETFLDIFTWPENEKTGELLNWLELPVVDKLWRPGRADKGGFLQSATGWKPSICQPYVYATSLENAARP